MGDIAYKDWKEHEIRETRRRTWTKKGFEELYGKGTYKQILDTASTGKYQIMVKELKLKKYEVHVLVEGDLRMIKIKAKNRTDAKKIIKKKYRGKDIYIEDVYDYPYEQY